MSIKSHETIICQHCHSLIRKDKEVLHRQRCGHEESTEIGVVDPDEVEETPTFEEAVKTYYCDSCEREVDSKFLRNHQNKCTPDDPLDVGLLPGEDGGEQ